MKLFNRIAYHSTTNKGLKEFKPHTTDDDAYKGEGAMVHGWGLYLQEDKELNIQRYKNTSSNIKQYTIDDKDIDSTHPYFDDLDYLQSCSILYGNIDNFVKSMEHDLPNLPSYTIEYEYGKKYLDLIKKYNVTSNEDGDIIYFTIDGQKHKFDYYFKDGSSQYTVEIPDDFVFINENDYVTEGNPSVDSIMKEMKMYTKEGFSKVYESTVNEILSKYPRIPKNMINQLWYIYYSQEDKVRTIDRMSQYYSNSDFGYKNIEEYDTVEEFYKDDRELTQTLNDIIDTYLQPLLKSTVVIKYDDFYESLSKKLNGYKESSEYLYNHGIDGIQYNGNTDGLCYVIFNCSKLKIIKEE